MMIFTTSKNTKRSDGRFKLFTRRVICAAITLSFAGSALSVLAQAAMPTNAEHPAAPDTVTDMALVPAGTPVIIAPLASATSSNAKTATTSNQLEVAVPSAPLTKDVVPRPLAVVYSHTGAGGSVTNGLMNELRIVHAAATQKNVATQVALNVAMLMLGGLGGGAGFGFRTFDKDGLVGVPPEDVKDISRLKNPALSQLVQEMESRSTDWLLTTSKTNGPVFTKPLVISSAKWRLVYNSLSAEDQTYQLKFDVDIYKAREKSAFFSNPSRRGESCHFVSKALPLNDWKAADYQAVVDLTSVAVAQCAAEFTAQLPELLELK